jgi:hypothetical protein
LYNVTLSIAGKLVVNNNMTAWEPYNHLCSQVPDFDYEAPPASSRRGFASSTPAPSPPPPINNAHPGALCFERSELLTIVGSGMDEVGIDGQGYVWWWDDIITGRASRPKTIQLNRCKDCVVEDLYIINSPYYHLDSHDSLNLRVTRFKCVVHMNAQRAMLKYGEGRWDFERDIPTFPLNTDCIDPAGLNILIEDSFLQNYDDAVAVKPMNGEGFYSNCSSNILVRNVSVVASVGMSVGSCPPNVATNCISGVTFEDIHMSEAIKAIYIKSNPCDNVATCGRGIITDIVYQRFVIDGTIWYPIFIGPQQQHQPYQKNGGCSFFYPVDPMCFTDPNVYMNNYVLKDIAITNGASTPGVLLCDKSIPCTNVTFDSVTIEGAFAAYPTFTCINADVTFLGDSTLFKCNSSSLALGLDDE